MEDKLKCGDTVSHEPEPEPQKTLTVSALIELLKDLPGDMEVWIEGCNYDYRASGIQVFEEDEFDPTYVLIRRKDWV